MTTNFKILLILIVIYASCGKKTESLSEIILANEKAIISIWPDNEILEELTQELGEEDLYVITDDKLWYESQLINKADSLNIEFIRSYARLIYIKTPFGEYSINNNSSKVKWRYFYFDGKELLEKDVLELIEI